MWCWTSSWGDSPWCSYDWSLHFPLTQRAVVRTDDSLQHLLEISPLAWYQTQGCPPTLILLHSVLPQPFCSTHCTTQARTRVFRLLCIKAINYVCVCFPNLISWAIDQGLGTNMAEWEHLSIAPEEAPIVEAKHSVITSPVQSFVTRNFHSTQPGLFPGSAFLTCPSALSAQESLGASCSQQKHRKAWNRLLVNKRVLNPNPSPKSFPRTVCICFRLCTPNITD